MIRARVGASARILLLALPLAVVCRLARADVGGADRTRPQRTVVAVRTARPPVIDGSLDDSVWLAANPDGRFVQKFPDEGAQPSEATEVFVLYDDLALYVGVHCLDSQPERIVRQRTRRDRDNDSDRISVDISSRNDGLSAYHFEINVAGVQVDGVRFNDNDYNGDWDGVWKGAVARETGGWTAELSIPFDQLRYQGDSDGFGFQVRRYLPRRQEIDEWSFIPRTSYREVSRYGRVEGLLALRPRRLFQLLPYGLGRISSFTNQPGLPRWEVDGDAGFDVKVGLTPALTFDGTVNPDFGQVEVDSVVLNLTTFETLLPEKRPFFLESLDVMDTPFPLFYSRRIGLAPRAPFLPAGAALISPATAQRIAAAGKLFGQVRHGLSIGALAAVTTRTDATVAPGPNADGTPPAPPYRLMIAPPTTFAALRLRQEFDQGASIGLMATAVNRFETAGAATPNPGDLCPSGVAPRDGRCFRDAYTGGVDARLQSADGDWRGFAHAVGSLVERGPTEVVLDGTHVGSGDAGWGARAEFGKYGGEHWLTRIAYTGASPRLAVNDMGYLDAVNNHDVEAALTWRTTHPPASLREASLQLRGHYGQSYDLGDRRIPFLELTGQLQLASFWRLSVIAGPDLATYYDNRETRDGARVERGRRGAWYLALDARSDPSRPLVFEASASGYQLPHGLSLAFHPRLIFRPAPPFELELLGNASWSYGDPRWFLTAALDDGSRLYLFGDLDARSVDVTARGLFAFTNTLTVQAYAQVFLAAGRYGPVTAAPAAGDRPRIDQRDFSPVSAPANLAPDFRRGNISVNLLLRWEYRLGSTLMLVYTRAQQQTAYASGEGPARVDIARFRGGPATDTLVIKLTFLWEPLHGSRTRSVSE